jgi:hypothetical protein
MAGPGDDSATAFTAKIDLALAMLDAINTRLDDHVTRITRVEKVQ